MPETPLDTVRAEFFKALAHPVRIPILRLLRPGERSVTELHESLGLEPSSTSQQLTALRIRSLVTARREGTRARTQILPGRPAEEIASLAERESAD